MRFMVQTRAAFTMTELLVTLAIVSALATLAVPVYTSKMEKAKIATAQSDCRQLAEAEDACAVAHGFYVPLQVLDDLPAASSLSTDSDAIDRESGLVAINPSLPLNQLNVSQPDISSSNTDAAMHKMLTDWNGPFINVQKYYKGTSVSTELQNQRYDYPLDPWGNAYRFYCPKGIVGATANSEDYSAMATTTFSNGVITNPSTTKTFDRYAVVSFGPDGKADADSDTSPDDIIYTFGTIVPDSTTTVTP